jgi:hypothetical protein
MLPPRRSLADWFFIHVLLLYELVVQPHPCLLENPPDWRNALFEQVREVGLVI